MNLLNFFFFCLVASFTVIVTVIAVNHDESLYTPAERRRNADRKKLGIPLAPPEMKGKGQSSNEESYLMPGDSDSVDFALPKDLTSRGYIGIHKDNANGRLLGYLACHKLVDSLNHAVQYSFTVSGPLMEINIVGSEERMAVTTGLFGSNLSPFSKNFHLARHTRFSSLLGAGPGHDKERAYLYETNVFSYVPDKNEIDVQWVNVDGSYVVTEIAVMDDRIYYTGDVNAFRTYTNAKVDRVIYKWYPLIKSK